jgi:hypothetical protein
MASVIVWMCPCGTHLKALHSGSETTMISCPNPECSSTFMVSGHIDAVFIEDEAGQWHSIDALTSSAEQSYKECIDAYTDHSHY